MGAAREEEGRSHHEDKVGVPQLEGEEQEEEKEEEMIRLGGSILKVVIKIFDYKI